MPQADGTIVIDTEINADGMKAGSKEVEAAVRRMAASVNDLGTKAKTALNKQVDSFAKLNQEYAAQAQKVEELKRKVAEYGNQKVPTDEYSEIQAQIDQARAKMDRLTASQEKFLAMGGSKKSNTYKRYQYDIEELANTVRYAEGELKDLENIGKAFTFGNKTKEAAADMERLAAAERKLADMNNRLGTSYSSIKGQVDDYKNSLLKSSAAQQKASGTGINLSKSLRDTGKSANSANFGIGRMLGTSILFSFAFQAISGVINAMKEGFTNLAQYSGTTNNSISMLMSSLETLKNSLATAFAPILDVVAPILSKFIDMLATAASYVSMFFAFLSGKSTYTKALAVQKDYAAGLEDTAGAAQDAADATDAAAEAAERYLSPLDDINRYTDQNNGSGGGSGSPGGGGGGGGTGSGPLFEEVPIDNKFADMMDAIIEKLKQIRNIFMSGFWDGLGDYKPVLEELKSDLLSIKNSLMEIFTDPGVQESARKFAKIFIYNLGRITGSAASIGLTIAQNLVGGVESYLSRNKDRVKSFLSSMFDVGEDVFNQAGLSAQTIAEIFSSTFGSQVAQNLTGNIIGIFASIGMTAMQIMSRSFRDNVYLLTQPFIDNKELIKIAILETIAPIQEVAQAFENFLNQTGTKLIEFYDSHVYPFILSITSGLSEIYEAFLIAYNEYIAPILDTWAQKITDLINGPISNFVDSFLVFSGKIVDSLKDIWEGVLVPLIDWIIKNVIPVISPIIEELGNIIIDFVGSVFDAASNILKALGGVIDFLVGIFTGDWERAFSGAVAVGRGFLDAIYDILGFIEKNIFRPFVSFVGNIFNFDWTKYFGVAGSVVEYFLNIIKTVMNSAQNMIMGVADIVAGVFTNDWSRAWSGVQAIFKGIWDSFLSIAKSPINGVISMINALLDKVETAQNWIAEVLSFSIDLPGWAEKLTGYSSFGISVPSWNIPNIPYLASGAVIPPNKEFMAVLGDQNSGNNIEAPERLIRRIVREESGNNGGSYEFIAQINRKVIFREVIEQAKLIRSQTGKNPFEIA